jgi:hypothetical protein
MAAQSVKHNRQNHAALPTADAFGEIPAMSKPAARQDDEAPSEVQLPAWPDEWTRALSDVSLRQASSAAIFQRGKAYATSGAVEVLDEDPMPEPALHAQVTGTDTYSTEVWIEDDAVAGSCDCPNAEDGWFCKHQVAVALVWRDRLAGHATPIAPSVRKPVPGGVKRARTAEEKRQALHDFLHGQEVATLADKLLEFADRDHDIARELQQWRKANELGNDPADLKTLTSEILAPGRGFIAWDESASYVRAPKPCCPYCSGPGHAMPLRLRRCACTPCVAPGVFCNRRTIPTARSVACARRSVPSGCCR